MLIKAVLGLRQTQRTSFRGYLAISHLFINKKSSVISTYVHMCFMFFIIYLSQVKVRNCYLSFKLFLLFHFITAVYVLYVSDAGAHVGGFLLPAKIALMSRGRNRFPT
jgi:hypothetical protein